MLGVRSGSIARSIFGLFDPDKGQLFNSKQEKRCVVSDGQCEQTAGGGRDQQDSEHCHLGHLGTAVRQRVGQRRVGRTQQNQTHRHLSLQLCPGKTN